MTGGVVWGLLLVYERFWVKNVPGAVFSAVTIVFTVRAFYLAWRDEEDRANGLNVKLTELTSEKAILVFDSADSNHVRLGRLEAARERTYCLGAGSLSGVPIPDCRVVLESADPEDSSEKRLGLTMKIRGAQPRATAEFTLNPGNGKSPSAYVEVLQEVIFTSQHLPVLVPLYSDEGFKRPSLDRGVVSGHLLTFRLEGPMMPVRYSLRAKYDSTSKTWAVDPA
jgi:hypothetical protein